MNDFIFHFNMFGHLIGKREIVRIQICWQILVPKHIKFWLYPNNCVKVEYKSEVAQR